MKNKFLKTITIAAALAGLAPLSAAADDDDGMVYAIFVCSAAPGSCTGGNDLLYRTRAACKAAAAEMQSRFTSAMLDNGDYAVCAGRPTWRSVD